MSVIFFRADAVQKIGTGHVMRCIALAQACRDAGNKVCFVARVDSQDVKKRFKAERMGHISYGGEQGTADDLRHTIDSAKAQGAKWIVLDGYCFDESYERNLKDAGFSVLAVDDKGERTEYCADIVLNQNLHADEAMYRGKLASGTKLLLGSSYVMLRSEFAKWIDWKREFSEDGCNVLVTLGGSDPDNMTCKVLQALSRIEEKQLNVTVVVGGSNLHYDDIVALNKSLGMNACVRQNVKDMSVLMSESDIAVSSGGTTVWELAYMGLPALVGQIAPVEDLLVAGLVKKRLFVDVGWFSKMLEERLVESITLLLDDRSEMVRMAELGRNVVDGHGCRRLLEEMGVQR